MPKVTLHTFTSSSGVTATLEAFKSSRAFEQVSFEKRNGGLIEAIEYYVNNNAPEVLILEESAGRNTLELLGELAGVLDGETELILIGEKDSIVTYKSLKSLGVFEYLLSESSADELLITLQAAAVKVRSGKSGKVIAFVPVCSARAFEEVFYNMLKAISMDATKSIIIFDLNLNYGNSDLILRSEESNNLLELLEKRNVEKLDVQQVCRTVVPGLDIISNSNDFSVHVGDRLDRIAEVTGLLRELYDNVFILLPNGWQKVHAHTVLRSNKIVLVSENYLNSYRDLVRLALYLNSSGVDFKSTSLIINCFRNNSRGKAVVREIYDNFQTFSPKSIDSLPQIIEEVELQNEIDLGGVLNKSQLSTFKQIITELGLDVSIRSSRSMFSNPFKNFFRA